MPPHHDATSPAVADRFPTVPVSIGENRSCRRSVKVVVVVVVEVGQYA